MKLLQRNYKCFKSELVKLNTMKTDECIVVEWRRDDEIKLEELL
jgi:hypothetical protein